MTAKDSAGTVFGVGNGESPETFTPFCVRNLTIGTSRGLVDVTTLCSTQREYRLALKDGKEMEVTAYWEGAASTAQRQALADLEAGTIRNFQVIFPGDSPQESVIFPCLVTDWTLNLDVDTAIELSMTLKPTGDWTWENYDAPA